MNSVASDERLTRRAIRGEERAFASIFERYHQRLYRYCLAIVGNPQDAQDALQNTMVKVLRALPGEERRIELKPWLYRIAHNESIELLRRRRETRELDPEEPGMGVGLAEEVTTRQRLRQLLADLDELPERQRGALVMRELSGLGYAEIATALGTSPAVARQTLYEARLGLRQMDEGRQMGCAEVTRALSDGDGRVGRRRDLRAHLRTCASCRGFGEGIESRQRELAGLTPLPAAAAAGLLQGLLGGGAGAGSGGGLATAAGGGAAKAAGASLLLKGTATVAVVAAIGVGAAGSGGLIDLGSSGGDKPASTEAARRAGSAPLQVGEERFSRAAVATARTRARRRGLDRARTADRLAAERGTGAAPGPVEGGSAAALAVPSASGGGSLAHPHGKGHEKQHPAASAHGQQTAAEHKGASHGSAAGGHPTHPAKSPHPTKPPKPAKPPHPVKPSSPAPPSTPVAKGAPSTSAPSGTAAEPESSAKATPRAVAEPETGEEP